MKIDPGEIASRTAISTMEVVEVYRCRLVYERPERIVDNYFSSEQDAQHHMYRNGIRSFNPNASGRLPILGYGIEKVLLLKINGNHYPLPDTVSVKN